MHGLMFIESVIWVMNNIGTKMNQRTLSNVGNYGSLINMTNFLTKNKLRNTGNISKQKDQWYLIMWVKRVMSVMIMRIFSEIWVISVITTITSIRVISVVCNIGNMGNVSNESKFFNEGNFSYKSSNKKEKENEFSL